MPERFDPYDDDALRPDQMRAMQTLDDTLRAGLVGPEAARRIEALIRHGHVPGALKRITEARRQAHS